MLQSTVGEVQLAHGREIQVRMALIDQILCETGREEGGRKC